MVETDWPPLNIVFRIRESIGALTVPRREKQCVDTYSVAEWAALLLGALQCVCGRVSVLRCNPAVHHGWYYCSWALNIMYWIQLAADLCVVVTLLGIKLVNVLRVFWLYIYFLGKITCTKLCVIMKTEQNHTLGCGYPLMLICVEIKFNMYWFLYWCSNAGQKLKIIINI